MTNVHAGRTAKTDKPTPAAVSRTVPGDSRESAQRELGNLATQRLIAGLRPKLRIGGAGDAEEREADEFARQSVSGASAALAPPAALDDMPLLRRRPTAAGTAGMESGAAKGDAPRLTGGQPLPHQIRAFFEPKLGRDLGDVSVHTGADAAASAAAIGARAYTVGSDIAFGQGEYQPDTSGGKELIAHELAHVRQADGRKAVIRRDAPPPNGPAADAAKDLELKNSLPNLPPYWQLRQAKELGGLTHWRQAYPLSYAPMRVAVVNIIGEAAFAKLENNDADILMLVRKSKELIDKLYKLSDTYSDQEAARQVIFFYTGDLTTSGLYDFDYPYFAILFRDNPRATVEPIKWLLSGTVDEIVANVQIGAELAQADADEIQGQRELWKADAEAVLGQQVAKKQRLIWADDKVNLESLIPPEYGSEDVDEMLTVARLSGVTTAVVKVKSRYYVFRLSEQYDRNDIYLVPDKDIYVELIPAGPMASAVQWITVNGGFVLRPPAPPAELYGGGDEAQNSLKRLESITQLQQSGKAAEYGFSPIQVFQRMIMDLALLNLQQAENRLVEAGREVKEEGIFQPVPSASKGDRLKRDVERLRQLTVEMNSLAAEMEGKNDAPDEQLDRRDSLLMETAGIVEQDPAAALFVRNTRDPDSKDKPEDSDVENKLGDKGGLDASKAAIAEVEERRENIAKVRRAIFDDPTSVLDFDVLHASVLRYFSDSERRSISIELALHSLDRFAHGLRMAAIDVALLIGGFFTEGGTWAGLAVHGAGVGFGLYQLYNQAEEAALLTAQSSIDVEGGFQLASAEQAKSARRWLLVSTGLNLLGVWGFSRTVGTFLRESGREAALVSRLAGRLNVTEEILSDALRRNWRGLPDPDPNALRKILLGAMDPQIASRYENIKITVLSDAEWLKAYPNSAANAETRFFTNAAGETAASEVVFRKSGNVLGLEEEAAHIQQAADPKWSSKLAATQDIAKDWGTLSEIGKIQGVRNTLEIELDAQQRLMERASLVGDTEALDDAAEQIEEIQKRIGHLDERLADPSSRKYLDWFDPDRPPGIFSTPRLPQQAKGWGSWTGRPGNSVWKPENAEAVSIVGKGNGVRFRNNYPDFAPWAKGRVSLTGMSGEASDFSEADKLFAEGVMNRSREVPQGFKREDFIFNGKPNASTTKLYRQQEGLTWHHHQGGKTMLLVPTKLHANVPHTGGASAARGAI